MTAKIGEKSIGYNNPTYIVFEAGPTHTGLESSKTLVDAAAEAGADAIKFQMMYVDRLMGDKEVIFSYEILTGKGKKAIETIEEPLYEILKRRELKKEEWKELKQYCDKKGLAFISTAMFIEEVDFLVDELEVPSIKLASGDINHLPLIRYIAKKDVNIQIDTGSADLWEIEKTITLIESEGNRNIIIHLCPTGYPARLESINLRMLTTLKTMFEDYAIAFSDHTPGWEMDIAAVALGANVVEKTITFDRTTKSCEHMFSLEPKEAQNFVNSIRELEIALGNYRRTILKELKEGRLKARRSIFLKRDLNKGEIIRQQDIEFRRPGYGIGPDETEQVIGRSVRKKVLKETMLSWEDVC